MPTGASAGVPVDGGTGAGGMAIAPAGGGAGDAGIAVRSTGRVRTRGAAARTRRTAYRPAIGGAPVRRGEVCALVVGGRREPAGCLLRSLLGDLPVLADLPGGCFLTLRGGGRHTARAFVPGARQGRPYPLAPRAEPLPRPPRRIEVDHADTLLTQVSLVLAPPLDEAGAALSPVIVDLVERGAALVFVTGTGEPVTDAEVELLTVAAATGRPVLLAVADGRRSERWPEVVGANQSLLARRVPALTLAPWYVVTGDADRAAGATELRHALLRWAATERSRRAALARAPRSGRAVQVGPHSADCGWERVLDRTIRTRRQSASQHLSIELARSHLRCGQRITDGGCASLPGTLDTELHGLSVLATRAVQAGCLETLTSVLGQVLERSPDPGTVHRAVRAVRALIRAGDPVPERALMVITTAGVAEVVGANALAGLSAYRVARAGTAGDPDVPPLLPAPFGLGVSAACYPLWAEPAGADSRRCRQWLQLAIRAVEASLHREIGRRFTELDLAVRQLVAESMQRGALPL